jgi:cytochrome c
MEARLAAAFSESNGMRLAIIALSLGLTATPALAADGAQLFNAQCKMCHQAATTPMAPTLAGVTGAKIAAKPGFPYSPGLKAKSAQTWSDANLDAYLANPTGFAPGTRMMVKVPAAADRQALIKYLATLK